MKRIGILVFTIVLSFGIMATSHAELISVIPDEGGWGVDIRYSFEGLTLNAVLADFPYEGPVYYVQNAYSSEEGPLWNTMPALLVEFDNPTDFVSIDMLGTHGPGTGLPGAIGWAQVYDSNSVELEDVRTDPIFNTGFVWTTVAVSRETFDISTAIFHGYNSDVNLSNLIYNSQVPIPSAVWLLGSGLVGLAGLRKKFRK